MTRAALVLMFLACAGPSTMETETETKTLPPLHAEADLVIVGGTVITMDPLRPRAEGIAIAAGHIERVGTADEVRAYVGARTQVIDLRGRAVTPGLVDGHAHLYGLGKSLEDLSLRGVASAQAAADRVANAVRGRGAGEWIEGRGWDQNLWNPKEFPTHALLDGAAPNNPVALRRIDGHALWANRAAMTAAGVGRDTRDPAGGRIVRDAAGEPTGVFIDNAMTLVEKKLPPVSDEVRRRRLLAAADLAVAAGLTGVHDMGISDETVTVYRQLAAAGQLKLRVYAFLDGDQHVPELATRKPDSDADGMAFFVLRGVKLYADGALGSRGAALLAPYSDDPGNSGLLLETPEALQRAAAAAVQGGWQLAVHAIGDRANRMVLDAIEAAQVPADRRFRVEHAQIVAVADIPRFAKLGVIASMQPTHATSDMPWAEARVGRDRLRGAYAWRSLLDAGARLSFGSDFPIEAAAPLLGIYAAVTRADAHGQPPGGWLPEQKLSLEEAVRGYTVGSAYAAFQEARHGKIAPGFVADLTVFDRDLVVDSLPATGIDLTIVGGKVVYDRGNF